MNITKVPIIQIIKNGETIEVNPLTSVNDIGVSSGSLKLITSIVDRELSFGKLISSQFSVQLFNIDDNLEGCSIQLFLEEDGVRTSKFKGVIDSSKRDNIGGYRDIIAYDWIYYHRNDDISNWWNNFWVSTRTSATIQEIRTSLLTYINMIDIKGYPSNSIYPSNELYPQDVTDSYINDSIVIPNNFNFYTDLKLHIILKMICELQAIFPHIDENGNMEFISIINTNTSDLTGLYEGNNSKWEDYTTNLITGVGIYSTSNDLSQLIGTTDNVYNISGNLFALTLDAQTLNALGNNILNAISNIQFTPSKIKMIVSDFDLKLGQRINTPKGYSYVMTNSLSGVCLIEQTIESKSMGSKLSQRADSRNDTLIEGAKMSKFEQTIDGFTTEVQRIDNVATQASSDASEALQTADGLADDVQTANNNASTALSTANNANTTAITAQSQVTQMADQIVLKVDNNGNVVKVALSSDASTGSNVLIKGDNIQLDGNVTITSGFVLNVGTIQSANFSQTDVSSGYSDAGVRINLTDGIITFPFMKTTSNGELSLLANLNIRTALKGIINTGMYGSNWENFTTSIISIGNPVIMYDSEQIQKDVFRFHDSNGTVIFETEGYDNIALKNATIFRKVNASNLTANRILVSDANKNIVSSSLSVSDLITTSNIGSQSVNYATSAGSASSATNAKNATKWNNLTDDSNTLNTTGTWIPVYNSGKVQHCLREFKSNVGTLNWGSGNDNIVTKSLLVFWNGAYSGTDSNFRYLNGADIYKSSNSSVFGVYPDGLTVRSITALNTYRNVSAASFIQASSRIIKENIKPIIEEKAKKLLDLNVVSFDFIKEFGGEKNKVGLIAEDTLDILPDIVAVPTDYNEEKTKQKIKNNEAADVMSIDYSKLTPYLVKIAQIQQRQIDELKQSNNFYQNIILQMQAEIEQIKQKTEE